MFTLGLKLKLNSETIEVILLAYKRTVEFNLLAKK